ncbi:hypothetical protein HN51_066763 [Arachis hypogaea]
MSLNCFLFGDRQRCYHAQFSPHFSPLKFELEQAYYATAESVRDRLIKEHHIRTGCGSVSVIVYGDPEKPALITYPDLALK